MPTTITELKGSRAYRRGGMFQASTVTFLARATWCDDPDNVEDVPPLNAAAVESEMTSQGYSIRMNAPFGVPDGAGSTVDFQVGADASQYVASGGNLDFGYGFELTEFSIEQETSGAYMWNIRATCSMVLHEYFNHCPVTFVPSSRQVPAWRVGATMPTLTETNGLIVDPNLPTDDIGGTSIDINVQPQQIQIDSRNVVFSCVVRKPFFKTNQSASLLGNPPYEFWSSGIGSLFIGRRMKRGTSLLKPIWDDFATVTTAISITPIAGTWCRMDWTLTQDEYNHLQQFAWSINGTTPYAVENKPGGGPSGTTKEWLNLQALAVPMFNPYPLFGEFVAAAQFAPAGVLEYWQNQTGGPA